MNNFLKEAWIYLKWPAIIATGVGLTYVVDKATKEGEITDSKSITEMVVDKRELKSAIKFKSTTTSVSTTYLLELSNGETSVVTRDLYNQVYENSVYTFETYREDGEFKIGFCRDATTEEYKAYNADKSTSMNTSEDLPAITREFSFAERVIASKETSHGRTK